ncbi:threonine--tRNA ligase [Polycyclovorans algicola]|uniref:threonine--tRNA ligase n=1 Tax=Polycyclovorans algicola TaxID=616992 RepID=UPI0004A6D2E5|nr:threonine--tRNA ligase [Polycyclovorans algicola]
MSLQITFPDGNVKSFDAPVTGLEIAQGISPGLAKKAVVVKVDGELWDLTRPITRDAAISIVTRNQPEAVEVIRHDAAHVMAQAVQELFPGTQITFGPSTEYGFYYDFARAEPFTEADLETIEKKMREIVKRDLPITREVWPHDRAVKHFETIGERYKAEWIRDGIAADEELTIYRQGESWLDMCLGPHLPSTGRLGTAFKLTKVSGAYWRGDKNNAQLQRIYGLAFATDEELKAHLHMLEEAEKRDHRRLGRQLDLFHLQEEAPGSVFWHPKGWTLFQTLIGYMRKKQFDAGYQEINTPDMMDKAFWETSGHWQNYGENMFATERDEDRTLCLKPMNCPGHVQIFNQGTRSYRELPLRFAEFGKVHRFEPSGALHGLLRVRSFTQDDGHVFCTPEQLQSECVAFTELTLAQYAEFGFDNIRIKLSTRPEKRIGADHLWDQSEAALADALDSMGIDYSLFPGEGAFYGPKLEFVLRDAIGRDWQCGTIQVDLNLPGRLDAEYIGEDGNRHTPIMLHRAIFGSLERFTGILIEHHAGSLPFWLSPVQAVVAPIVSDADNYARDVCQQLKAAGVRADTDLSNEKINKKIRELAMQRIPVIVVVGRKEAEEGTVTLRLRGEEHQKTLPLAEAVAWLKAHR